MHTDTVVKKARQRLYHLRELRRFIVSQRILNSFYSATIQSILTGAISVWDRNSSCGDQRALQRVVTVGSAEQTIGSPLCRTYTPDTTSRARRIIKFPHNPGNRLFVTPQVRQSPALSQNTHREEKCFPPGYQSHELSD